MTAPFCVITQRVLVLFWSCSKSLVRNYYYTLRNDPEERISYLLHQSRISFLIFCHNLLDHVPALVFLRAYLMLLSIKKVI